MTVLSIMLFFILGVVFGSFFNVVGLRLPEKLSFTSDRSRCSHCGKPLTFIENIPVFSFFIQHGRCRNCNGKISFIYPLVECTSGILFAWSFHLLGWQTELIIALLLVSMLMIILVSDLKYMVIPDSVLLFFLPLFIILRILEPLEPWWSSLAGALTGFLTLALIIIISRGGMGAGDMKLFGLLGIVLGTEKILMTFFLSALIGTIAGSLLLAGKTVNGKQPVPFGPFIVIASLVTYFHGDELLSWYFHIW
ncbi:A24 family peptidase [Virgibacillus sp. YIM 98842]|jgi:leader peptidase (prepilin peptidase)/N-methyltransferase|uniref:prepilin peptidase n=1 Tax=Virgibacillus sp. YIM 98842 TaxID=2663533 RepID=UPI0013D9C57D|nr:A24 family peptidase [Virgibacillus sp. YIM 98842]